MNEEIRICSKCSGQMKRVPQFTLFYIRDVMLRAWYCPECGVTDDPKTYRKVLTESVNNRLKLQDKEKKSETTMG